REGVHHPPAGRTAVPEDGLVVLGGCRGVGLNGNDGDLLGAAVGQRAEGSGHALVRGLQPGVGHRDGVGGRPAVVGLGRRAAARAQRGQGGDGQGGGGGECHGGVTGGGAAWGGGR